MPKIAESIAPAADDDFARVERVAEIAAALGATRLHADAVAFAERIAEGRIYVACVGQFKRGKSSLLNALVGEPVLPMGLVPVTAVPTVLRHGCDRAVRIHFTDGAARDADMLEIEAFVTEARNPENVQRVDAVEVFVPSALLADGLCLVDTPGLGSIFRGTAAATRALIPHVDALLVVLGADPPISGDERELVAQVAPRVNDVLLVLNKADRFTDAERAEARAFTEEALARQLGRPIGPVLEVSAVERLARRGPPRDFDQLVGALGALTSTARIERVRTALARGAGQLVERCLTELTEWALAFYRPVEESERRLEDLQMAVGHVAYDSLQFRRHLEAERARAIRPFVERRDRFLAETRPAAARELMEAIVSLRTWWRPALRRQALRLAAEIAHRRLEPWLAGEAEAAESAYNSSAERCLMLAREALARVPAVGETVLGDVGRSFGVEDVPVERTVTSNGVATPLGSAPRVSRMRWLLDIVGPRRLVRRAIEQDAGWHLDVVLTAASDGPRLALGKRLDQRQRVLEAHVQTLVNEVYGAADRALARARVIHAAGKDAVRRELDRRSAWRRQVLALRQPEGHA